MIVNGKVVGLEREILFGFPMPIPGIQPVSSAAPPHTGSGRGVHMTLSRPILGVRQEFVSTWNQLFGLLSAPQLNNGIIYSALCQARTCLFLGDL